MLTLGLDTSNYTTSAAIVEDDAILENRRTLLKTKEGQRGLRQSDALFQHWENLPVLLAPVLEKYRDSIAMISVSTTPRPQNGSYMPVFNAGKAVAQIIASALCIPVYECSHQEGHIYAAAYQNQIDFTRPVICAHLSGGTLEVVRMEHGQITVLTETLDISYGQLLDRIGVALGFSFPAGAGIDRLAMEFLRKQENKIWKNPFCPIHITDQGVNLSGLETQLFQKRNQFSPEEIAYAAMDRISENFRTLIRSVPGYDRNSQILISGGVACSQFLRERLKNEHWKFGRQDLCSDNAVGTALCAMHQKQAI